MQIKKNKFIIFYIVNVILLIVILTLSFPLYKFLSQYSEKSKLNDNEFVINSVTINPNIKSLKIIDRTMQIKFVAKVDKLLEWEFKPLQERINIKVGENRTISYEGRNLSNKTIISTAQNCLKMKFGTKSK